MISQKIFSTTADNKPKPDTDIKKATKKKEAPKPSQNTLKQDVLAAALRANLRKRKDQQKKRNQTDNSKS